MRHRAGAASRRLTLTETPMKLQNLIATLILAAFAATSAYAADEKKDKAKDDKTATTAPEKDKSKDASSGGTAKKEEKKEPK
jgi:hypothetical protein